MRFALSALLFAVAVAAWGEGAFRLHILRDPMSLRPLKSGGATSQLLNNLFRGYYWQSDERGLVSELVNCRRNSPTLYVCRMRDELRYSGGRDVKVEDFVRVFHRALSGEADGAAMSQLLAIKNVREILAKKKPVETVGVKKSGAREFTIELAEPDQDLLYRFAAATWTPLPAEDVDDVTLARDYATGPFRLTKWERNRAVKLEPNPHYVGTKPQVPVEFLIVTEDTTALKLYQTNRLDFLRRVPAEHYPEVKNEPGFAFRPLLRMDYFGFGGVLKDQARAREALTMAVDYEEFKKIFHALGRPGCFGLSRELSGEPVCYRFDPKKAREIWDSLEDKPKRVKLYVAEQGGDDLIRTAQWYQAQWKKHLGLAVDVEIMEFAMLSRRLRQDPPDVFRRGVPLDRGTCLAGLEPFTKGNPDNFLQLERSKLEQNARKLRTHALSEAQKRQLCREALKDLLNAHALIPTGELHFMTLLRKTYAGVELNALNQLNLAGLRKLKPDQSPSDK